MEVVGGGRTDDGTRCRGWGSCREGQSPGTAPPSWGGTEPRSPRPRRRGVQGELPLGSPPGGGPAMAGEVGWGVRGGGACPCPGSSPPAGGRCRPGPEPRPRVPLPHVVPGPDALARQAALGGRPGCVCGALPACQGSPTRAVGRGWPWGPCPGCAGVTATACPAAWLWHPGWGGVGGGASRGDWHCPGQKPLPVGFEGCRGCPPTPAYPEPAALALPATGTRDTSQPVRSHRCPRMNSASGPSARGTGEGGG